MFLKLFIGKLIWSCYWRPANMLLTGVTKDEFPITLVTITPIGKDDIVSVIQKKNITFSCITDFGYPAASIMWFLGGQNVTNQATSQTLLNGSSYSTLIYTGNETDHDTRIYCVATNIGEEEQLASTEKNLFLISPVTEITIFPAGVNNEVKVILGENLTFTCVTNPGRPAALIQWYIGGQNVTNLANTTHNTTNIRAKYISTSKLVYTGNEGDHNTSIYCEAFNPRGGQNTETDNRTISIDVPVSSVNLTSDGEDGVVNIIDKETKLFTCTTTPSRPAARIYWYIGERNVTEKAVQQSSQNGTKFISYSELNYEGNEIDHNTSLYCRAVNIEWRQSYSSYIIIHIQIPITSLVIRSANDNNTISIVSGEAHNFTCTTDASRPPALIQWYIGERNLTENAVAELPKPVGTKFISSSTLLYTGNKSDFNKSVFCSAGNIERRQKLNSSSIIMNIQVLVKDVTIMSNGNSITAVSDKTINLTCTATEARPAAWINWYIDQVNVTKDAFVTVEHNNSTFDTLSYLQYTGSIKDHGKQLICKAGNIPKRPLEISNISLLINSSTVAGGKLVYEVGVRENEGLNLSMELIANPEPTIRWSFSNSSSDEITLNNILVKTTANGIFQHVTMYTKSIVVEADFGNYTVFAMNGIGANFTHSISVLPKQSPRRPYGISAKCLQTSANVSWFSNFNGGDLQIFTVVLTNQIQNDIITTNTVIDKGRDMLHFISTDNLQPGTTYEIYVRSNNNFGVVSSNEETDCTTDPLKIDRKDEKFIRTIIGGVCGSAFGLFVIVFVAVFVIRRQRNSKGNDREKIRKSDEIDTDNKEDELEVNPLYVSSDDIVVYTNATKTKSTEQKVESYFKGKLVKMKKSGEKGCANKSFEMDCVYENADDIHNDGSIFNKTKRSKEFMNKKNKDGLIYADLEFVNDGNTRNFVIRGLENRTNYAIIDMSKKVDPLPESDIEDVTVKADSKEDDGKYS